MPHVVSARTLALREAEDKAAHHVRCVLCGAAPGGSCRIQPWERLPGLRAGDVRLRAHQTRYRDSYAAYREDVRLLDIVESLARRPAPPRHMSENSLLYCAPREVDLDAPVPRHPYYLPLGKRSRSRRPARTKALPVQPGALLHVVRDGGILRGVSKGQWR